MQAAALQGSDTPCCLDVKDVVMGLHWSPAPEHPKGHPGPANLDAVCVLLDAQRRRLGVVGPGSLANVNGSVMHTGDSRFGASTWDDERIFVFVDALPAAIHSLLFGVVSPNGQPFSEVAGASCHISDYRTEDELLRVELTALGALTECAVATLQRSGDGWIMRREAPDASLIKFLASGAPDSSDSNHTPRA